jgi:hypothetical protein
MPRGTGNRYKSSRVITTENAIFHVFSVRDTAAAGWRPVGARLRRLAELRARVQPWQVRLLWRWVGVKGQHGGARGCLGEKDRSAPVVSMGSWTGLDLGMVTGLR